MTRQAAGWGSGMAREAKAGSDQIDIDGLRQLLELMEKHDVRELKLQRGDARYVLRRGPADVAPAYLPMPHPVAAPAMPPSIPAAAATGGTPTAAAAPAAEESGIQIKSPTVRTFYQSGSPGDPPFVKAGDSIKTDTVVCIVEAMKVFNQIPAGVSGVIAKVLVADGDAVEFGQPLFLVKPH